MRAPNLWAKSHFSFLHGASSPEELVDTAVAQGHTHVAITDRNGLYGAVRAHMRAKKQGIRLVVGAQMDLGFGRTVVLLAPHHKAYQRLCHLISHAQLAAPKGEACLNLELLCAELASSDGPICLCSHADLLPRLAASSSSAQLYALCARYRSWHQHAHEQQLVAAAQRLGISCVAAVEVLYHTSQRRALQDVVTCLRHNVQLTEAGKRLQANAEHAHPSPQQLAQLYADKYDWLEAACALADRCTFNFSALRYRYPVSKLLPKQDAVEALRARVMLGSSRHFGRKLPAPIAAQLEREISIITDLDYGGYFLSMQEIVAFCRSNDILCQGRGSAANSLVCYCLGITAVSPYQMDLLFERFISKARAEPPDIDLDIEHHRREEVLQWVYAHYGRDHAAMVANVVRFRWRSAVRQVGQVLGLPQQSLVNLSQLLSTAHGPSGEGYYKEVDLPRCVAVAGLDPNNPVVGHLIRLSTALQNTPRHLSMHPGGFVLGHEPINQLCPIEPATMAGRTVICWDKQDVEDLGLFKVDLLGLGALSHVHETFTLIKQTTNIQLCMASVPQEDPATYSMITRGDTIGVFQIESRAQMSMLPRLKPKTFYDLVVEVALVRPGPIQGEMVHPYLRQRQLGCQPSYPHPVFEQVLSRTFGVPIFQEQVMKLAILAADYTPDQADVLRRDMAAWRSHGRLEAHRERIVKGMIKRGVSINFAERIFKQIRGFGEYGFPESHAASFAHIVYVTAYLRCHYPAAFTCALINAQPMGFYNINTIIEDAKRHKVVVLPIAINHSAWKCTLEPLPLGSIKEQKNDSSLKPHKKNQRWAVRMGLGLIKGFGQQEKGQIAQAGGLFRSVADVLRRSGLNRRALSALISAGALEGLPQSDISHQPEASRPAQLWQVLALTHKRSDELTALTSAATSGDKLPECLRAPLKPAEAIAWDLNASHHSVRGHPLAHMRSLWHRQGWRSAHELLSCADGQKVIHAGLIICRQRPQTAKGTLFLTLEDETGLANVVLWPDKVAHYQALLSQATVVAVVGTIQAHQQVVNLLAHRLFVPQASSCT